MQQKFCQRTRQFKVCFVRDAWLNLKKKNSKKEFRYFSWFMINTNNISNFLININVHFG